MSKLRKKPRKPGWASVEDTGPAVPCPKCGGATRSRKLLAASTISIVRDVPVRACGACKVMAACVERVHPTWRAEGPDLLATLEDDAIESIRWHHFFDSDDPRIWTRLT